MDSASRISSTRKHLGVSQKLFAKLIGVTDRTVSTWELGGRVNPTAMRRITELGRLADALRASMKPSFIPTWLTSPLEGLDGLTPLEAMHRGENDRVWRIIFFRVRSPDLRSGYASRYSRLRTAGLWLWRYSGRW